MSDDLTAKARHLYDDPVLNELALFLYWCNGQGYVLCKRRPQTNLYVPVVGQVLLLVDRYAKVLAAREERDGGATAAPESG